MSGPEAQLGTDGRAAQRLPFAHTPLTIGLTPLASARYRTQDLDRIRRAAPGARLVMISYEGAAEGPLDDVDVVLRGPLPAGTLDRLIARAPSLRWVHSATVGVEKVLTPLTLERRITITNARGVFSEPIAEYVLMMILATCRRLPQLLELQRERTWQPLEAVELRDLTIGIVGFGSIGRAVARLARPFGARIIGVRRHPDGSPEEGSRSDEGSRGPEGSIVDKILPPDRLSELLTESDYVVLALPLTPGTEDLFDESVLQQMKPGSWLVNVARGRLVDEWALIRALRDGPLGGAVLDAFREEPLPPDSPLYRVPNLIITPHTSWWSRRVLDRTIELFCRNLGHFQRGEVLENIVDPALGY